MLLARDTILLASFFVSGLPQCCRFATWLLYHNAKDARGYGVHMGPIASI